LPSTVKKGDAPAVRRPRLSTRERDVRRLEQTLGPLPEAVAAPVLVVLTGLPGSGKSHLARELSRRHPLAVLNSDALRAALFPHPQHSDQENARLFSATHAVLDRLLARGVSAALDATNLREAHRRPLYQLAGKRGARLLVVQVTAPEGVAKKRLRRRRRGETPWDISEAGPEVYDKMRAEVEPVRRPHITVDTSKDIGPALDKILAALQAI